MISDTTLRYYPYGEKAAQLTGYVQNITAEELEERKGQGYNQNSIIGKAGAEDGCMQKQADEYWRRNPKDPT